MTKRRLRGRPADQRAAPEPMWLRIDLHLHTPGSGDFQEPRAGYLDILQKAETRGLDIIAFTDHNSVAGYAAMERELEHLVFLETSGRLLPEEARRLNEYRRLREQVLVLPGFEFTATFGFHILGIFPPETSVRKLEHILLELNIPEEKLDLGTSEVGATTDVLRAYEIIANAGGLVIGAHVNSTHGIAMIGLGFGGQTKIAYTQDPNLHALEVTDLENASRRATARFYNGSKPEYPRRMHCIQGSDAHRVNRDPLRPEKNLGVGDRCTEVLLPEASFAALKGLFTSTDFSRTRPYRPPEQHPFDPVTNARAEGATIVQAFHDIPGPPRIRVKAILRDLVAFANTNGGVIVVGASADQKEPIRGVEGAAELSELLRTEAARQVVPPLAPDVETLTSEGKTVLMVTVPKGTETPYALEPGYIYVRQESETTLALRDEIVQLVRSSLAPATTVGPDSTAFRPRPVFVEEPVFDNDAAPNALEPTPAPPAAPVIVHAPAPLPQLSQQVAVQEATAAERDRQQDRTPVPRTGVEVIASVERNGMTYHTVRDLRNRRVVRNVTRESARRLWRYAILQAEEHPVRPEEVQWDAQSPRYGCWKGYRQPEGMRRYNLVYREPTARNGGGRPGDVPEANDRLRVFYGVTEDGIDERWRAILPPDSALSVVIYDEPGPTTEAASLDQGERGDGDTTASASLATVTESETLVTSDAQEIEPVVEGVAEIVPITVLNSVEAAETTDTTAEVEAPTTPKRSRNRRRSGRKDTTAPASEPVSLSEGAAAAEVVVPVVAEPPPVAVPTPPPVDLGPAPEDSAAPAKPRRRAPRRTLPPAPQTEVVAVDPEPEPAVTPVAAVADNAASEVAAPATKPAPRRRRAPRKAAIADDGARGQTESE